MNRRTFLPNLLAAVVSLPLGERVRSHLRNRRGKKLESPKGATLTFGKTMVRASVVPPPPPLAALTGFRITGIKRQGNDVVLTWDGDVGPFVVWREGMLDGSWSPAPVAPTFNKTATIPIKYQREFFKVQARAYGVQCHWDGTRTLITWTVPALPV